MIPTRTIFADLASSLAGLSSPLSPVALANHVVLSKTAFSPGPDLDVAGYTPADFTGSTPLDTEVGAQIASIDPVTTQYQAEMVIPAGGWRWTVTALTNLPQTIYGVVLQDNADAIVFGSVLFPVPIVLDTIGQVVEVDAILFQFNFNSIY